MREREREMEAVAWHSLKVLVWEMLQIRLQAVLNYQEAKNTHYHFQNAMLMLVNNRLVARCLSHDTN